MKTAEEWANETGETVMLDCFAGDRNAQPGEPTIKLIKQIQLDAFKAGEMFAAEIASKVETNNVESDLMCKMHLGDCPSAILTDANNRTELP